jgi:hypothetical protein
MPSLQSTDQDWGREIQKIYDQDKKAQFKAQRWRASL